MHSVHQVGLVYGAIQGNGCRPRPIDISGGVHRGFHRYRFALIYYWSPSPTRSVFTNVLTLGVAYKVRMFDEMKAFIREPTEGLNRVSFSLVYTASLQRLFCLCSIVFLGLFHNASQKDDTFVGAILSGVEKDFAVESPKREGTLELDQKVYAA